MYIWLSIRLFVSVCVAVLLFFRLTDSTIDHPEGLTVQQLAEITGITRRELARIIQSLALAKYKLLSKAPATKDVKDDDMLTVNKKFSSKSVSEHLNQLVGDQ